jgi:hypothetical protein
MDRALRATATILVLLPTILLTSSRDERGIDCEGGKRGRVWEEGKRVRRGEEVYVFLVFGMHV